MTKREKAKNSVSKKANAKKATAPVGTVMNWEDLKQESRFKNLIPISEQQFRAQEQVTVEQGEIYWPIFFWKEQRIVIDGYPYLRILSSHPGLKYTLKGISFPNWNEVVHWVVETNISRPFLTLWQKLDMAFQCPGLWEKKAQAKRNQAREKVAAKGQEQIDVLQIIADTVGCGRTLVGNYKRILKSGRGKVIEACRRGETSISTAYEILFPSKKKKTVKRESTRPDEPKVVMVTEGCDIFEECENAIAAGRKSLNRMGFSPVDPIEIRNRIKNAKVPDAAIWVVLYRDKCAMHVATKRMDKDKGIIYIKVSAFRCHIVDGKNGVAIYEAEHITGSTDVSLHKDESEFETAVG